MMGTYIDLESIAAELEVPIEDVELIAWSELSTDEWDEDMERVTPEGRMVILIHFHGGEDPK